MIAAVSNSLHFIRLSGVLKTNVRNYVISWIRNIKGSLVVNCKRTCGKSWDNSWIKWKRFSIFTYQYLLDHSILLFCYKLRTVCDITRKRPALSRGKVDYVLIYFNPVGNWSENCRKLVVVTDSKASWVIGEIMVCREWHVLILFLSSCLWSKVRSNFAVYFVHYEAFHGWIFPLKESLYFFLSLKFWMANLLRPETK